MNIRDICHLNWEENMRNERPYTQVETNLKQNL